MPHQRPDDETQRLAALRALGILDTAPEQHLQALVDRAARRFDVPMAALVFIDAKRVWFKATVGLAFEELPREAWFTPPVDCARDAYVVVDASGDARYAAIPSVAGAPGIRFFAAAPVCSASGHVVGLLCVMNTTPGDLNTADRLDLANMAEFVASELMVRKFVRDWDE